jgi:hypothetical protein
MRKPKAVAKRPKAATKHATTTRKLKSKQPQQKQIVAAPTALQAINPDYFYRRKTVAAILGGIGRHKLNAMIANPELGLGPWTSVGGTKRDQGLRGDRILKYLRKREELSQVAAPSEEDEQ